MQVLDLLPGGGWYTKLLAPTLEAKGKLYIAIGAERTGEALKGQPGFGSLEVIPFDCINFVRTAGERRTTVPEFSFGVMVWLTILDATCRPVTTKSGAAWTR